MKPSAYPDFFRRASNESREATIFLSHDGRFWHGGRAVEHPRIAAALHRWIARHPQDGRPILNNGYDWCYLTVEDAAFTVVRIERRSEEAPTLTLSDSTSELLDPRTLRVSDDGVLYARVKGGSFDARFGRQAQAAMAPLVEGDVQRPAIRLGDEVFRIRHRPVPDGCG